jgi:hypothetical protein
MMLKSDKTGMKDAIIMSAIIGAAFLFVFLLFAAGAFFSYPGSREFIGENPFAMAGLGGLIFLATFGFSLRWTVGMGFRSSTKDE